MLRWLWRLLADVVVPPSALRLRRRFPVTLEQAAAVIREHYRPTLLDEPVPWGRDPLDRDSWDSRSSWRR